MTTGEQKTFATYEGSYNKVLDSMRLVNHTASFKIAEHIKRAMIEARLIPDTPEVGPIDGILEAAVDYLLFQANPRAVQTNHKPPRVRNGRR